MSYVVDVLVMVLVILLAFLADSYIGVGSLLGGSSAGGGGA